jgi:hypothetical protein
MSELDHLRLVPHKYTDNIITHLISDETIVSSASYKIAIRYLDQLLVIYGSSPRQSIIDSIEKIGHNVKSYGGAVSCYYQEMVEKLSKVEKKSVQ